MRRFVVDIDAGCRAHLVLQGVQHDVLAIGQLLGGVCRFTLLADELPGEVRQRAGEGSPRGADAGLRRVAIRARRQLRQDEIGARRIAGDRQKNIFLDEFGQNRRTARIGKQFRTNVERQRFE